MSDKEKDDDFLNSLDTSEPQEMRPIWEGFSLDRDKDKDKDKQ